MGELKYKVGERRHGFKYIWIDSWNDFFKMVEVKLLDKPYLVFRGQFDSDWLLESTYTRLLKRNPKIILEKHLDNFKYFSRGRYNNHTALTDDEFLSLGQHYGMATPFLDFTESPFVSLFFAFEMSENSHNPDFRVVYILNKERLEQEIRRVAKLANKTENLPSLEIIRSYSNFNSRIVNQSGLFLRVPIELDVEQWLIKNVQFDYERSIMVKILIPNRDRENCLKFLNKMNINHLTLFPDIQGASLYSNMKCEIENY